MNAQKIAIMVDSGLDIPQHIREQYNMYLIPLKIIYGDKEYADGIDITADEVYGRLQEVVPTTSLPGANEVLAVFDQIKADGYEKVLAFTISSGLSGTHNLIHLLAEDYEGLTIRVIDTKNIAIGGGFNAIQAARHIEEGMAFEAIEQAILARLSRSTIFFCVDTLEYLQKGGRIGLVASILGTALHLKPIISCNEDGVYYNVAKIRGRKQSIHKVLELALQFAGEAKRYNIALCHGGAEQEALALKEELLQKLPHADIYIEGQISPTLGVHTGPGLVGVGVQVLD